MEFQNNIFSFRISSWDKKKKKKEQRILNLPQEIIKSLYMSTYIIRYGI